MVSATAQAANHSISFYNAIIVLYLCYLHLVCELTLVLGSALKKRYEHETWGIEDELSGGELPEHELPEHGLSEHELPEHELPELEFPRLVFQGYDFLNRLDSMAKKVSELSEPGSGFVPAAALTGPCKEFWFPAGVQRGYQIHSLRKGAFSDWFRVCSIPKWVACPQLVKGPLIFNCSWSFLHFQCYGNFKYTIDYMHRSHSFLGAIRGLWSPSFPPSRQPQVLEKAPFRYYLSLFLDDHPLHVIFFCPMDLRGRDYRTNYSAESSHLRWPAVSD